MTPSVHRRRSSRTLYDSVSEESAAVVIRHYSSSFGLASRLLAEPVRARFSAWYELFPRSTGKAGRHGTLRDAADMLPYVAEMGFDVVYLPPIYPIGRTHRKGPNNALIAGEGDPGELTPRLGQRPTSRDGRRALVYEHDGRRAPDGDLLPQRADPSGQLRVGRLVARGRGLEQVRDAVAGRDQRLIGRLHGRPGRQDPCQHQPPPERPPEAALVVVAGFDADR